MGSPPHPIYTPSEDTFLMVEALSKIHLRNKTVLDLGTGSGILGFICAQKGARVTATDVNEIALEHVRMVARKLGLNITIMKSDIFSNITEQFDLALFNPPYVPSEKIKDRAVDGGNNGRELIDRFLADLPQHLNTNGSALLLVSSLNDTSFIIHSHPQFAFSIMAKNRIFFEELQVLLCRFRDFSS